MTISHHPIKIEKHNPAEWCNAVLACTSEVETVRKRFSAAEYGLMLLCFCFCVAGALMLPIQSCSDETGKRMISDWISIHGTLPTGFEPEVIMEEFLCLECSPDTYEQEK